jgi:hypothetical protein
VIRRILVWLAAGAFMALVAGGVIWAVPNFRHAIAVHRHVRAAAAREPAILAEWTERFGDAKTLEERFPSSPDDAIAIEVAARAKELGIDWHASFPREPGQPLRSPEDQTFEAVFKYVRAQIERASGDVEAPPAPVCEYLDQHRPAIEEIAELLARSEPPRWEASPASFAGPVPNLMGHLRLQRVLLADALARSLAGENAAAERRLLAAWKLNASLRDRVDDVSQTLAVAIARAHAGVARWIDLQDPEWERRLTDHDYRASLLRATAMQASAAGYLFAGDGAFERASRADFYGTYLDVFGRLESASIADSARGSVEYEEKPDEGLSAGGIMAPMGIPNLTFGWRKVDRLRLEAELTSKILAAKRARGRDGRWPEHVEGIEKSLAGEPHWIYAAEDGRIRIGLSAPLEWKAWSGWAVPLEFASD